MSIGSHSFSPGGPNGIIRSQSFAGFSGLQERRSRCNSFIENSPALKKPQAKVKKAHHLGHKSNSSAKEPQPERMEEVYKALKNGLDEYLEIHQTELDKLSAHLKDMKRNSRLGVLYELDKQMKAIERYMRKLEFHISKVDELFEAYCIQRRLRDGASKMKQAYGLSPASKAARESLSEINKTYKEYTENLCAIEGELENLMGEFCIKMKGLAGFARLCPGDQYEIFMRYGRQRWKLKGKIEVNDKQSWDGEEMIFLPLIAGLISIKVTEVKGLATHILVGSVTCETKDLFAAQPQIVAVDINDLGTIKLNLEITWHPFDVEDITPSTGNTNKASAIQRRMSIYSQGTPETPTFKDQSFFLNLPDDVFENGTAKNEKSSFSFSFNDITSGHCTTSYSSTDSSSTIDNSNPEIIATTPGISLSKPDSVHNIHSSCEDSISESNNLTSQIHSENMTTNLDSELCQSSPHLRGNSVILASNVSEPLIQDTDELSDVKPVELDTFEGNITKQLVKRLTSGEGPMTPEKCHCEGSISGESEGYKSCVDGSLEEAFQGLLLALEPHKAQFKEFQELDQGITHLDEILKCRPVVSHSRSSSLSLTIENALESFDFLNTSDFEDEGGTDEFCGDAHGADSVFLDTEIEKNSYRSEHPEGRGHLSEALTEDTGVGTSVAGSPLPLTTGNESLDITIVKHLQYCTQLIQQIVFSSRTPFVTRSLLDKLSQQILVIENLAEISSETLGSFRPVSEAIPEFQKKISLLSFWNKCTNSSGLYHTSADKMIIQLDITFSTVVNGEYPGLSETVFGNLISHILDRAEPLLSSSLSLEVITVFQYYSYLANKNVSDLANYLLQLAREALMAQTLQSLRDEKFLQNKANLTSISLSPQQEVLKSLAVLLTENKRETYEAVVTILSAAAAENKHFREKALIYYCESLAQPSLPLQKAACLALKCLQATESIKMLVTLCQSGNEEVRNTASETLLSLGEDGRLAYEQLDKFPREFVKVGGRRTTEVATAF
ncbi:rho family-interacting cell polarization regulator 2 isoform X4 [Crotalus tigris]|nr:rho family-interacting cell polarization regulator 2 isoform X4 [Crotalus tigris]XP_039181421.1 rho family-interacting cell polarization regulator 2 isoform X4 [Crotalus tigris]XP_039181422.1 rho family-interacting cell polarization regulator 2 isoform X4 [Crotalus tigris]XP_039181423.1 rho family-interacting cell polarization regulator 2 isoform X4 [Crotalus tigris]XP_039181424.1 rho family-interacting cell polarization regulator 2 isoform X4 [Crotalus tigris]XP_039181425.1 rho family-inte